MSIADFLFTPSLQKVLSATLLNPGKSFSLRELLRLADSGRGGAQKQVDRLVDAGVLREGPRSGNQRSIQANPDFALFPELVTIARKSFGVAEPLKQALSPYAKDISKAFVFGSVAKGSDKAKSDIDLIIVGTASLLTLSGVLRAVELELGRPINFSLFQPDEWASLVESDPVMAQISKGPTIEVL